MQPASLDSGAYFDERAALYDRFYDGASGYALRSRMTAVLKLLGNGPADVLDAGMGPGRLLAELVEREWVVHGIDASAEMVASARRRLPSEAPRLLHARIESLPYPDASFDAVVATGVLEYANVGQALSELRRVLRPGGKAVVSYPNPGNFYWFWRTHLWYPTVRAGKRLLGQPPLVFPQPSEKIDPERFSGLLGEHGLRPLRTEYTSFLVLPSPLDALSPRMAERLGRLVERNPSPFSQRLAGQVVYSAEWPPADSGIAVHVRANSGP